MITGRDFIKKLLEKNLDMGVSIVVNTDEGRIVTKIDRIYSSDDICIEVDIRTQTK